MSKVLFFRMSQISICFAICIAGTSALAWEHCDSHTNCKFYSSETWSKTYSCKGNPGFWLAWSNRPCSAGTKCQLNNDWKKCQCYMYDSSFPQVCSPRVQ